MPDLEIKDLKETPILHLENIPFYICFSFFGDYGYVLKNAINKKEALLTEKNRVLNNLNPLNRIGYDAKRKGLNYDLSEVKFDDDSIEYMATNKPSYVGEEEVKNANNEPYGGLLWGWRSVAQEICIGVHAAIYENFLSRELDELEKPLNTNTNQLNLNWNGTPGEFGAIMKELMDKGYIHKIKDLKNTVSLLFNVFEIKNEDGNKINENYLYKCFSEKIKKYNYKNELLIPYSDNFNKAK